MPLSPSADIVARILRVVVVLVLAVVMCGSLDPAAATAAQDSDGDGIPDALDPDDDNDGTLDNPNSGGPPAGDADGDSIPDALDPDDNNNAVVDRDEPRGPSQPPPTGGNTGGGGRHSGGGNSGGRSGGSEAPVLALPVTGSGQVGGDGPGALALTPLIVLLVVASTAGWHLIRAPRRGGGTDVFLM